ncbi:hypothetical protein KKH43_03475 [Patescibacteria group bacterium]|nr:hypothetical protein [Patescibacteria group bacterium]
MKYCFITTLFFLHTFGFAFAKSNPTSKRAFSAIPLTILQFNGSHKCPIVHEEALVQILNVYAYFHPDFKRGKHAVKLRFKSAKSRYKQEKARLKELLSKKDRAFIRETKKLEKRWTDKGQEQQYQKLEQAHMRFYIAYPKMFNKNVEQLERATFARRLALLRIGLKVMKNSVVVLKDWENSADYMRNKLREHAKKGMRYFYLMHCAPSASTHILTMYFAEMIGTDMWRPLTPKRAFYFGSQVILKSDPTFYEKKRWLVHIVNKGDILAIMSTRSLKLKNVSKKTRSDRNDGNFAHFRDAYWRKYRVQLMSTLLIPLFADRTAAFAKNGKKKPLRFAADSRPLSGLLREKSNGYWSLHAESTLLGDILSPKYTFAIHGGLGLYLTLNTSFSLSVGVGFGDGFGRKGLRVISYIGTYSFLGQLSFFEFNFHTRFYVSLRLSTGKIRETMYALVVGPRLSIDPALLFKRRSRMRVRLMSLIGPALRRKTSTLDAGFLFVALAGLSWQF